MADGSSGGVRGFFAARRTFVELAIVAVVLAIGTNLLASAVAASANVSPAREWILGVLLTLSAIAALLLRALPSLDREVEMEGLLVVAADGRRVVEIDRYNSSEALARYFKALFAENRALQQTWESNPLSDFRFKKPNSLEWQPSPALKLFREAVEYHALHELALHLSAHFTGNPEVKDENIVQIGRKDIPAILLENRFLELFSRPMDEREAFLDGTRGKGRDLAVYAGGKGGAIFSHFELILPSASKVTKSAQDGLVIATPRFTLAIKVECQGFNSNLPGEFEKLYLGRSFKELTVLKYDVRAAVSFKRRAFLATEGWEAYRWVDGFLERLQREFAFEPFLKEIGWDTALTVAHIASRASKGSRSHASDSTQAAPEAS